MKIPPSLDNIFNNLIKYGHMTEKPENGNLSLWAAQGCLMLNTALTVVDGEKKSHSHLWSWFTDEVISYISKNCDEIIFVIWGADAAKKLELINQDRHHTIISSHPSGLSAHKKMGNYPAFMDHDHFGIINDYLFERNKRTISWDCL